MRNTSSNASEEMSDAALEQFRSLVESVGVKKFASSLGISTRQVNRILSGVQPNPIFRLIRSLQSAETDAGNQVLDFICQEMGGFFVREEGELDVASSNAVKECAEAIAAISDGHVSAVAEVEVREAICALVALLMMTKQSGRAPCMDGTHVVDGSRA